MTTYQGGYSWNIGSALNCSSGQAVIRNCTFANNDCLGGYALHFVSAPSVFENNILYGNTTNGIFSANELVQKDVSNADKGIVSTVRYTCVAGGVRDYSDLKGVMTTDPKFVASGDYRLSAASPCRNAGTNDNVFTSASIDLDGNARIVGKKVDLGCYECQKQFGMAVLVR